jgi:glycosyltransferase involved in cell wall biosynthesis
MIVVEPGIGSYNSLVAPYAVFESYSVMDHVYGKHSLAPRPLDSVIPNYFNVNDFIDISKGQIEESVETFVEAHAQKLVGDPTTGLTKLDNLMRLPQGQYVVVIARLIHSKGIQIAIDACREANIKLVIAGQGRIKDAVSATCQFEETDYDVPHGVTHVGYVEPLERAVLLARAKCLMAPTLYAEPFGGVNVEAQMCGLPVITTDWGAFAETVLHGYTGYRCRTLEQFLWALKNVDTLDKSVIRAWAVSNYGLTKIATMYEEYFGMLQRAQKNPKNGFYQENPGRLGLTWLQKSYPQS